jgi:cell division protein FtsL
MLGGRRLFWLLVFSPVFLTACSSCMLRQSCEKTNWFQYGEEVAMRGQRLSGDNFIVQCEKVEAEINHAALSQGFKKGMAKYCQPETVYQTGRKGEFFSPDMCDGENLTQLKKQHEKGVRDHCQKNNGYSVGASGKTYNNICPKELETDFMPEFNRGRKVYLISVTQQKEKEIGDIEHDIADLDLRRNNLLIQVQALPTNQQITRQRQYDPATKRESEQLVIAENPETKARRDGLLQDIESINHQIREKQRRRDQLRQEIRELNAEAMRL